jgi:hypothetical protein
MALGKLKKTGSSQLLTPSIKNLFIFGWIFENRQPADDQPWECLC